MPTNINENLEEVLERVKKELAKLIDEKAHIDELVRKDLELMAQRHLAQSISMNDVASSFINNNFEVLKKRKEQSIDRTIKKLEQLKREITSALAVNL